MISLTLSSKQWLVEIISLMSSTCLLQKIKILNKLFLIASSSKQWLVEIISLMSSTCLLQKIKILNNFFLIASSSKQWLVEIISLMSSTCLLQKIKILNKCFLIVSSSEEWLVVNLNGFHNDDLLKWLHQCHQVQTNGLSFFHKSMTMSSMSEDGNLSTNDWMRPLGDAS